MTPKPVTVEVTQAPEVLRAQASAKDFARHLGFDEPEQEEIGLVVSELASNLVKHAGGGAIRLTGLETNGRSGIQIESEDKGPGILDAEQAVTDGYSTAGSLGIGLGTVNRLMDDLEFHSGSPSGLHLVCQRWLRPRRPAPFNRWLEFGAATRPCRMGPENGDAVVLRQWEAHALAGVIDGLGHGAGARLASQKARQYLEQHFDQPLESLFRGVGRTCRGTRGVVMTLGRFELAGQKVALASIGNVEARLIVGQEQTRPVVRRGVLGLNAPNPIVNEYPWTAASLMIIHSDGLRSHWQWQEFQELAREAPGVIALQMLRRLGKLEDDSTIVVAKSRTR
jgi:anti-sigma regulatory factor (Ser/Thr protein kinase)